MGQKQTWSFETVMSALPPKADMAGRQLDVRFVPKADILRRGVIRFGHPEFFATRRFQSKGDHLSCETSVMV
jgi:hypothetical protein